MIYTEPPIIIVFAFSLLTATFLVKDHTGDNGRYQLFHELSEVLEKLEPTDTCDDFGFITKKSEPNCIERNGFRYFRTGTTITFYRMDEYSVPHVVWTASLNPYHRQIPVSRKDLHNIHTAFSER